jgi:hypothetical protein
LQEFLAGLTGPLRWEGLPRQLGRTSLWQVTESLAGAYRQTIAEAIVRSGIFSISTDETTTPGQQARVPP